MISNCVVDIENDKYQEAKYEKNTIESRSNISSSHSMYLLSITAFLSIQLIDDLQGNARVVNYIGIVRGATQRLVKKELNHEPDDNLIKHLDKILDGLSNGSDEFDLIKLESQQFQSLLVEMKND